MVAPKNASVLSNFLGAGKPKSSFRKEKSGITSTVKFGEHKKELNKKTAGFFDFIFGKKKQVTSIADMLAKSRFGNKTKVTNLLEAKAMMGQLTQKSRETVSNEIRWNMDYIDGNKTLVDNWNKSEVLLMGLNGKLEDDTARYLKYDYSVCVKPEHLAIWILQYTGNEELFYAVRDIVQSVVDQKLPSNDIQTLTIEKALLENELFKKHMEETATMLKHSTNLKGVEFTYEMMNRILNGDFWLFLGSGKTKEVDSIYNEGCSVAFSNRFLTHQKMFFKEAKVTEALVMFNARKVDSLVNGFIKVLEEVVSTPMSLEDMVTKVNESGEAKALMDWMNETDKKIKHSLGDYKAKVSKLENEPVRVSALFSQSLLLDGKDSLTKDYSSVYEVADSLSSLDFILDKSETLANCSQIANLLQKCECLKHLESFYNSFFEFAEFGDAYNRDVITGLKYLVFGSTFTTMDFLNAMKPVFVYSQVGAGRMNKQYSEIMKQGSALSDI